MKIIIITPAIPRPELHTKCISSFYKNLFLTEQFDEIIHIINIDSPKKIVLENENLISETIKNLNKIIPENVKKIIINEGNSDFCEAYKRIFLEAEQFLTKDSCLIYLEDDWEFLMVDDIGKNIKNFCFFPNVIYSLSAITISNNPIVYGFNHAKTLINFIKNNALINIDPDYILRPLKLPSMNKRVKRNSILKMYFNKDDRFKKHGIKRIDKYANFIYYEKQETLYLNLDDIKVNQDFDVNFISNLMTFKNCIDKGREWLESKNIEKWEKNADSKKTY